MATAIFDVEKLDFETKALSWAQQFGQFCFLQSNGYVDNYGAIESILAVEAVEVFESNGNDTFEKIEEFKAKYPEQWVFGFFSYDLKDEIENLSTPFPNTIGFPAAYFFVPNVLINIHDTFIAITAPDPFLIFKEIQQTDRWQESPSSSLGEVQKKMSKADYLNAFQHLKSHIQRGDIYEINLCQEFFIEHATVDPYTVYQSLNRISPTPFSTFFKIDQHYIISASPERFLAKRGETLISQPIKGTAARGSSLEEDLEIIQTLQNNPKEIAENVMIVDLVRNDMTRSAKAGTVATERKLEVKTYKQVHQLVSTITCTLHEDISDIEAIKQIFPPGSMTGAPKINAMLLADQYEFSRRGVYAGAVGYFAPNGDFDFNVIIRTILYDEKNKYLSFHTGGAITIDADADKEYEECLLKASAIIKALKLELA